MNADSAKMYAVADVVGRAIAEKDVKLLASVYADNMKVWHSYDNATQTRQENLDTLAQSLPLFKTLSYTKIRRVLTEDGYVQQHILSGEAYSGHRIDIPVCQVCTVADGKLVHLDEYLDIVPVLPIFEAASKT